MYPNTNLQPGQTGPEVKKLQDFLASKGLMTPQPVATGPGIYGPQTTAAVKKFQEISGVDNTSGPGFWGPRTIAKASGGASYNPNNGKSDPNQPLTDAEYEAGASNNPKVKEVMKGGSTLAEILTGIETGDISGLRDPMGQPFSAEDQQDALNKAEKANAAYYDALKTKEKAETEASLAKKQADYQDYLLKSGQEFQEDKTTADQTAANRGVLFSGGRVQKEKNLQSAYERDQATKLRNLTSDIGGIARDYQYSYGKDAAKGLSSYYKAGANTYNANVANGGVGSTGLSSVYNPRDLSLGGGTRIGERAADAQRRAAGLLWNKGNKLLASGYNNQY